VVNTAANSSLGVMLYKLCTNNGIKVINLVRTQKIVDKFI